MPADTLDPAPSPPQRDPLDFTLPPHLEAHEPPEARGLARDGVRLLLSDRAADRVVHARFADLPDVLRPGDLVVANDSATLPAALTARRADGTTLPLHLSTRLADEVWVVEPRLDAGSSEPCVPLQGDGDRAWQPARGKSLAGGGDGRSAGDSAKAGEGGDPRPAAAGASVQPGQPLRLDAGLGRAGPADPIEAQTGKVTRLPGAGTARTASAGPGRVRGGEVLHLPAGATATLLGPYLGSERLWLARLAWPAPWLDYLRRWGRPIAYPYLRGAWPISFYQTVYADEPGSAEMPSAGRAFSPAVLERLAQHGIGFATLTLHTGVASLEAHEPPYPEPYRVPEGTARAVNATRAGGGRIVAVGTTVVRTLETVADAAGQVHAGAGWTDLVISPARPPRAVDALLTGFHEPRASHLALLEAFAGRAHLARAYQAALDGGYLWHEFGDLHLVL